MTIPGIRCSFHGGIFAETLIIVQSSMVARYFFKTDLSLAISVTLSTGRLSSVIHYTSLPVIAERYGFLTAIWCTPVVAVFALLCASVFVLMDGWMKRKPPPVAGSLNALEQGESCPRSSADCLAESLNAPGNIVGESGLNRKRRGKSLLDVEATAAASSGSHGTTTTAGPSPPTSTPTIRSARIGNKPTTTLLSNRALRWIEPLVPPELFQFPVTFWLLVVVLISLAASTISFIPIAPGFFEAKYFPDDPVRASSFVSVPDSLSVVLLPIAGYIADRAPSAAVGSHRKSRQVLASSVCVLVAHCLFAFTTLHVIYGLLILGVGYGCYASVLYSLMAELVSTDSESIQQQQQQLLQQHNTDGSMEKAGVGSSVDPLLDGSDRWPSDGMQSGGEQPLADAATTINESEDVKVASAYGISGCLMNISFSVFPILIAGLLASSEDLTTGYFRMELFYVVLSAIGVLAAIEVERRIPNGLHR